MIFFIILILTEFGIPFQTLPSSFLLSMEQFSISLKMKIFSCCILASFGFSFSAKAQYGGGSGDGFDMIQISQTLSVSDPSRTPDFSIFPNPVVQGELVKLVPLPGADFQSLRLVNPLGESISLNGFWENESFWIPTHHLASGNFVLQMLVGKDWSCQTLVVK